MNTIKFLKEGKIRVNGIVYKPYTICDLPTRFGCINYGEGFGISEWLHLPSPKGGLTNIIDESRLNQKY